MTIRFRLILSYLIMLAVPLLLTTIGFAIVLGAFVGNIGEFYKFEKYEGNPIAAILHEERAVTDELRHYGADNPDMLLQPGTQQALSKRLRDLNMGLIVRRDEEPLFVSPNLDKPELLDRLPKYGENVRVDPVGGWLVLHKEDLKFANGSLGSAYTVMDMYSLGSIAGNYFDHSIRSLLLFLLVVFVATNGLLTYFVSRSIVRPLRTLQHATDAIKGGNLDFSVDTRAHDEIGSLSRSFEEMRRKLKESVDRQLADEDSRRQLIASISHDLKTPITSIKGYVEGIRDGVADSPEKLERYLNTIHTKTEQMDRLIDELFLFSKLDLQQMSFNFEAVEPVSFVRECADSLQLDMEKKNIAFELIAGNTLADCRIRADRDKLKRALTNILENAIKYMDKDEGRITVRLGDAEERVIIQVEDNGKGIREEELPYIFDRFYRADTSRNTDKGGSGLGLAIVKQIVERHGGAVEARSIPGRGTSIYFTVHKDMGELA